MVLCVERCLQNTHVPGNLGMWTYLETGSLQMRFMEGSEMRLSWMGVALNPMAEETKSNHKRQKRREEAETQKRSHMEIDTEMGGTQPHAQGHLESPEAGGGRKEPPLGPGEGVGVWTCPAWTSEPHLDLNSGPQSC